MAYQQIASGNVLELPNLGQYEPQIDEGGRCLLELDLLVSAPDWAVSQLKEQMELHEIPEARVESGSPKLRIFWRKGFAWIPIIIVLVLALAIMIIGWRLFKDVAAVIPAAPLTGIIVAVLVVIGLALWRRK